MEQATMLAIRDRLQGATMNSSNPPSIGSSSIGGASGGRHRCHGQKPERSAFRRAEAWKSPADSSVPLICVHHLDICRSSGEAGLDLLDERRGAVLGKHLFVTLDALGGRRHRRFERVKALLAGANGGPDSGRIAAGDEDTAETSLLDQDVSDQVCDLGADVGGGEFRLTGLLRDLGDPSVGDGFRAASFRGGADRPARSRRGVWLPESSR
jgi:hypothetical protein